MAWGDRILPSLRPAVKVYVATGRFLPTDGDTALYAAHRIGGYWAGPSPTGPKWNRPWPPISAAP